MREILTVIFHNNWVNCDRLEESLECGKLYPHEDDASHIIFNFPENCKIMIDSGIRILSLANQLNYAGKKVELVFHEGEEGTMGYLSRMGFFDY